MNNLVFMDIYRGFESQMRTYTGDAKNVAA